MERGKTACALSQIEGFKCSALERDKCENRVRKLQARIEKALEAKRFNKAKALQHLLDISMARKCIYLHPDEPV